MDTRSSRCKPRNVSITSQGETGLKHDWVRRAQRFKKFIIPTRSRDCRRFTAHVRCALRPLGKIDHWTFGPLDYWTTFWTIFIGPLFGPFFWTNLFWIIFFGSFY